MSAPIAAEQNVIGACLLTASAFWQVADLLAETDFVQANHRVLWRAIGELARREKPFDAVTIGDWLDANGVAELAGGVGYVYELANNTASAANVRAYAEIVASKSLQRRVADAGTKIAALAGDDALIDAQAILAGVCDRVAGKTQTAKQAMRDVIRVMQEQSDRSENLLGVPTGLPMLDDMTAGWRAGELVLVAGRPSMGKSLLAMQFAMHAAKFGHTAHVVTLEMPTGQCVTRMLSSLSNVPFDRVMDAKKIDEGDWPRIIHASETVSALPLHFDDDVYDLARIIARIRQVHAQHGTRLVVIDYLTFMRMPKADTMALAVQEVTRELKALAKALGITVILVSQLNRGVDGRADKRPFLSDLRESGAIEQDADVVLMMYRDEYHDSDSAQKGFAEILIRKQRNGRTGLVAVRACLDVKRFDPAPDGLPESPAKPVNSPQRRGFDDWKKAASNG